TGELWGQGEHYLLRSMKLRTDMRIHALLGNLYDRLGRADDAARHWRLASGVAGVLPTLPVSRALPAADMRGDPTLIDVGRLPQARVLRDMPAPVAASAADFAGDEFSDSVAAAVLAPEPPPPDTPSSATAGEAGLDEYFDSAPIPGVDVSQTSDRPARGSGRN